MVWNGGDIVPKKVEQINDHLFIGTYKSNNIKLAWMIWRWMIAKCVCDETANLVSAKTGKTVIKLFLNILVIKQ